MAGRGLPPDSVARRPRIAPTKEQTEAAHTSVSTTESSSGSDAERLAEIAELGAFGEMGQLLASEAPLQRVIGGQTRVIMIYNSRLVR